jgi:hypothetical protein
MPAAQVSLSQFANAQLGVSYPLAYGYHEVRGNEILNYQLANKNHMVIRLLGEGEWDGIDRLWINSKLVNPFDLNLVHFHPGTDGTLGVGLTPLSSGRFPGVTATNLVVNGDGETGTVGSAAPGWTLANGNSLLIANDAVHSGSKSLKVTNATANDSYSYQDFSVVGGVPYRLQGWIKTSGVPNASGHAAVLNIDVVTGVTSFTIVNKSAGATFTGINPAEPDIGLAADGVDHNFTLVSCVFIPNASGTIRLYLQLGYGGVVAGNAWFDDVSLASIGEQEADAFWSLLPGGYQPLTYSRIAYLMCNVPPDPGAPSAQVDILGHFRCLRVRDFDSIGNQTGYAFSTNTAKIALDAILRSMLNSEWLTASAAAAGGDLTAAQKARIDWPSYADAVAQCDAPVATGIKRFETSVAFTGSTSLQDALMQICMTGQLYVVEVGGKIYIRADQSRASTFLLTADHVQAGSAEFDKTNIHGAKNRLIANYRDLNPESLADIDTVANSGLARASNVVTVKTTAAHGLVVNDNVQICAPLDPTLVHDTSFDGIFVIASVPSTTTFTYAQTAANATSGNGYIGTPESRFAQRAVQVDHEQHQQAIGQRGLGLTPQFRVIPATVDFGANIEERVRRALNYIKNRSLGQDTLPYKAPWTCKITAALDSAGVNVIPDPDGGGGTWSVLGSLPFVAGIGAVRGGGWRYTGTGAASGFLFVVSKTFAVVPGQTYTLSGYIDATNVTGATGAPAWLIDDPTITTNYAGAIQANGVNGRVSVTFSVPAGVTQVKALPDTGNCTVVNGLPLTFSNPQLEIGPSVSPFDFGGSLIAQMPGDVISIDASISEEFQGDYELQKATYKLPGSDDAGGPPALIDLELLQYLSSAYSDGTLTMVPVRVGVPRTGVPAVAVGKITGMTPIAGSSPMSQAGATTQVNFAAATYRYGDGDLAYNSGSSFASGFSVVNYGWLDDPAFLGGTPGLGYHLSTTVADVTGYWARAYLGKITCLSGGGGGGIGGGGGNCVPDSVMIRQADGTDLAIEECYARWAAWGSTSRDAAPPRLTDGPMRWLTPWGAAEVERMEIVEDQPILELLFDAHPALARYGNLLPCAPAHTLKVWGLWEAAGEVYVGGREYADDEQKHHHDLRGVRIWIDGGVANLASRTRRPKPARVFRTWLKEHHVYMTNGVWAHNVLNKT